MGKSDKEIKITCTGTTTLPMSVLTPYNLRLKDRRAKDIQSLARKIIDKGFSFPIFVWHRPETSQNLIIDGNGRYLALQWLEKKQYTIPSAIPVVRIFADDEKQARKKVLEISNLNSRFSQDAFILFAEGLEIDFSDYTIPNLDTELLKSIQATRVGFFPPTEAVADVEAPQIVESSKNTESVPPSEGKGTTKALENPMTLQNSIPAVGGAGDRRTLVKCPHCGKEDEILY